MYIIVVVKASHRNQIQQCTESFHMPTKRSNAQHLVEYEKQLLQEENKNIEECHAIAYAILRLWYKFEVRKFSRFVRFTFHVK